ncbi:MAG TPA: hypothetical protein VKA27_18285, partial [Sunxiuqinia sp.]|nr:hypothetical protein [Sunxiuqinia sp.]
MKYFLAYLLVFSIYLGNAQSIDQSRYQNPIKVACIGNSITYGYIIKNRPLNSYPTQLGRMLGDGWEVRNFGVNGR